MGSNRHTKDAAHSIVARLKKPFGVLISRIDKTRIILRISENLELVIFPAIRPCITYSLSFG